MIRVSAIAHRYGHVLYKIAAEGDIFDPLLKDLDTFVRLLAENPELERIFHNPLIRRREAISLVETFGEKLKLHPVMINFLKVLALRKRLPEIVGIFEAYKFELSHARKQVVAKITTPHELSPAYQKRFAEVLQKKTGKNIKLEIDLDPTLMGGIIIRIESVVVDASLKSRLSKIQHTLERVA